MDPNLTSAAVVLVSVLVLILFCLFLFGLSRLINALDPFIQSFCESPACFFGCCFTILPLLVIGGTFVFAKLVLHL